MLSILTKYLLQYRRLCIPHIGTFEIVQHAPEFDGVDKLIQPPTYRLQLNKKESLSEHQLNYLAHSIHADIGKTWDDLHSFGKDFKNKIHRNSFTWNGIGIIKITSDKIAIDKELIKVEGLDKIHANKLLRENVQHSRLIGDQEMTNHQATESLQKVAKERSVVSIIGWIVFLVALVAIIIFLYKNGFNPLSSGLKLNAT